MKVLFYAAKIYDKRSFDPLIPGYEGVEVDYIDPELEPRTATLAKGYDAICAFVSADVGAKTLEILKECGVKTVLMRCAGFNNVDIEKAKELGITVKRVPGYSPELLSKDCRYRRNRKDRGGYVPYMQRLRNACHRI